MTTFDVKVKQYLRPNGSIRITSTELPISVKERYTDMLLNDCHFEAEVLSTGLVSLTISSEEEDVDIEVVGNGPDVQQGMIRMLERGQWK